MSDWHDQYKIVRRKAERLCVCRGCDKNIARGEQMIYTYSMRNRGQHIFFCFTCADLIGKLANEVYKSDAD